MSESKRRRRSEPEHNYYVPVSEPSQPPRSAQPHHDAPPPRAPRQPRHDAPPPVSDNHTVIVNQVGVAPGMGFGDQSYFDGGLLSLIGWSLLAALLTVFTLGLGYPFAACMLYNWEARHTIINGRRLRFDGNGWQLIGKWIIWFLLTIITLGIYSFWLTIKLKQWRVSHTHFE